jgi:hypothetical protein
VTDVKDHEMLKSIISEHQPELISGDRKRVIFTTSLRPATFRAVKSFLRSALKNQGLDYPS